MTGRLYLDGQQPARDHGAAAAAAGLLTLQPGLFRAPSDAPNAITLRPAAAVSRAPATGDQRQLLTASGQYPAASGK